MVEENAVTVLSSVLSLSETLLLNTAAKETPSSVFFVPKVDIWSAML
ncbi:hypothetical protein BN1221_03440c [Brenneria goodwinii]|uniref:Uncharacterized protein n=1 Tax=Brenneria goodwinii TaxID=1109412 RepID=A0A0G4JYE9_9GAMM|nr:hypothetical protein BN1221_03440c [Brenneria goodwinii]